MDSLLVIIILVAGGALGAILAWLMLKGRASSTHAAERAGLEQRVADLNKDTEERAEHIRQQDAEIGRLRTDLEAARVTASQMTERAARIPDLEQELGVRDTAIATFRDRCIELAADKAKLEAQTAERARQVAELSGQVSTLSADMTALQAERAEQGAKIAELLTTLEAERQQAPEKVALLLAAKEQLSDQFKALANDILEDKSKRFAEQNQMALGQLLEPLKTKLQEFQGKVEEVYVQEGKDRSALAQQVKQLLELNQQLSQDAHNLTRALKGDSKAQGNWGEVLLERMLETAGLRKGHEYDTQTGYQQPDGGRVILDVVVYLPEQRHLVIDSKVSLKAYEAYVNADSESDRAASRQRHLESVRTHIKGLSVKAYQDVFAPGSPDFVVMFVPIEPAFLLAIGEDPGLWQAAWDKSVLLVSPSSLLFVLRSVAYLWRQEQQSKNAQDIAARGALLYDKLVRFVEDLGAVGQRLAQAQQAHDEAVRKLSTGKGSLIGQAEKLRQLGIRPRKPLPTAIVDQSEANENTEVHIGESLLPSSGAPEHLDGAASSTATAENALKTDSENECL